MPGYLARTGLAVFAMLFAITFLTLRLADGRVLVASTSTIDLPQLREIAPVRSTIAVVPIVVASFETAPAIAAPPRNDAVVVASWYGPGFYGNPTACGQTYTPEILGVAHLTLPCGTTLTLTVGSRSITVTLIDRGPYIAGRAIDLSSATKLALGCTDLCTVRMQIGP
jgi:rare lipoprotein A (peptidoglycan hydrolase)